MGRCAQPLRATALHNQDLSEQELETLNGWLGVVPARVRQFEWLEAPAIRLAADAPLRGLHAAQADESGVLLGRSLHALTDGRLALLHLVGTWTNPNKMARMVTTIADAQLIEPWVALQHFPLHRLLGALRSCLWDKSPSEDKAARAPDLEARRARFTTLIADLDAATRAHRERLRRVGDEAAGDGPTSGG